MKRKWQNIKQLEPKIIEMRIQGKTRQEIADTLGLSFVQVKNWVNRHNKEIKRIEDGVHSKKRGRPGMTPKTKKQYENRIKSLEMENELLRDFLWLTGRG